MRPTALGSTVLLGFGLTKASPVHATEPDFEIQWGSCGKGQPAKLDCGQLQVPVNWSDPTGDTITLRMNRLNATDTANRIGSVIINPGGPGSAASTLCYGQALGEPVFGEALAAKFDLICPDPRGDGTSTPIVCDPAVWNANSPSMFPTTEAEFEQSVNANRIRGENCLNLTGSLLNNMDSVSNAKDFEAIRVGLNDGLLNYIGLSYGTVFGAAYAQLYPDNIRTMALDGIVDHTQDTTSTGFIAASSFENELDRFFEWCAANATACGFSSDNIAQSWDDLIASANKNPIPAPQCANTVNGTSVPTCNATVNGDDIRQAAQGRLQTKNAALGGFLQGWNVLGTAMNSSINQHDATAFSPALATANTSILFSGSATACQDWIRIDTDNATLSFAQLLEMQTIGDAFNPHTGDTSQQRRINTNCAGWPTGVKFPEAPLNETALSGTPPILMVNAVHDPSTSYIWAVSVRQQLPNAVLLTRQGDGHTSYLLKGQAAAWMDTYIINKTLPEVGTVVYS